MVLWWSLPSAARWTWGPSIGFAFDSKTKLRVSAAPRESQAVGRRSPLGMGSIDRISKQARPQGSLSPDAYALFCRPWGNLRISRRRIGRPAGRHFPLDMGSIAQNRSPAPGPPVPLPPAGVCR